MTIINAVLLDSHRALVVSDTAANGMNGNAPAETTKLTALPLISAVAGGRGPGLFVIHANNIATCATSFDDLVNRLPAVLKDISVRIQRDLRRKNCAADQRKNFEYILAGYSESAAQMQVATFRQADGFETTIAEWYISPDPGCPVEHAPRDIAGMVVLAKRQIDEMKRLAAGLGREVAAGGRLIAAFVSVGEVRLAPVYDFATDTFLGPARPRSLAEQLGALKQGGQVIAGGRR